MELPIPIGIINHIINHIITHIGIYGKQFFLGRVQYKKVQFFR